MTDAQVIPIQVDGLQRVGDAYLPRNYEVWADGVFRVTGDATPLQIDSRVITPLPTNYRSGREQIARTPVWISGLGVLLDDKRPLLQLSYVTATGTRAQQWCNRGDLQDTRRITALADIGVPVSSNNARDMVDYMSSCERINGGLPVIYVGGRSSYYETPNGKGWLLGDQWIGPGTLAADTHGQRPTAYHPKGTWESWRDKWLEVRAASWMARWRVASSFASLLLRHLDCRSFFVHHFGKSGRGKSAVARFALSVWGDPVCLEAHLNRTNVSVTEVYRYVSDLPVLFDELQVSTVAPEQLIYGTVMEQGRGRATKVGGLRLDVPTWRLMAWTTGEREIVPLDDRGGMINRVIQLETPGLRSEAEAKALHGYCQKNYGHAGHRFCTHLADVLNSEGGLGQLRQWNDEFVREIKERSGSDVYADYLAAIALGQWLSDVWLLDSPADDARTLALNDALAAQEEALRVRAESLADKALTCLRDHYNGYRVQYLDDTMDGVRERHERMPRCIGIVNSAEMLYLPTMINKVLADEGFLPERVWQEFKDKGWLIPGEGRHLQVRRTFGDLRAQRVYAVRREILFGPEVEE